MNNLGLKLVSVFFALILWLVVVNVDNPTVTRTVVSIPVTPLNEQLITDEGNVYRIVSGATETIQIKGPRNIVDRLTASDFSAVADFSKMSVVNAIPITVSAKETRINNSLESISQRNYSMVIEIEKVESKNIDVEVQTTGKPANGYVVNSAAAKKTSVKVSAPISQLEKIAKAVLVVDVSDADSLIKKKEKVHLYDETNTEITALSEVTLEVQKIQAIVQIDMTKKVDIQLGTSGTPAEGYSYEGIEYSPKSVTICGQEEVISSLEQIVIPNEVINIDGWNESKQVTIDITNYLPKGVGIYREKDRQITVELMIEAYATKDIVLDVSQIQVLNVPEGYEASVNLPDGMKISLQGTQENIKDLEADSLSARVDVSGCKKGKNTVMLVIDTPTNVTVTSSLELEVRLTEKKQ